jgi:hypothetical protein
VKPTRAEVKVECYGGPCDGALVHVDLVVERGAAALTKKPRYDWEWAPVPRFQSGHYAPEFDGRWGTVLRWHPRP